VTTAEYENISGVIRIYGAEDSYKDRDGYTAVVSVSWRGDNEAFLYGMHGTVNTRAFIAIACELKKMGADTVSMKRVVGHKIPFGKMVKDCGKECVWVIDMSDPKLVKILNKMAR